MKKENIIGMFKAQYELDKAIFSAKGISEYPLEDAVIAFNVELGELCQEWQGFKYWKENKVIDRDAMLEEWADCMHFALSIDLYDFRFYSYKIKETLGNTFEKNYYFCPLKQDIESNFRGVLKDNFGDSTIEEVISSLYDAPYYLEVIELGYKLGFSGKEMIDAYFEKNKINWDRLNSNY